MRAYFLLRAPVPLMDEFLCCNPVPLMPDDVEWNVLPLTLAGPLPPAGGGATLGAV